MIKDESPDQTGTIQQFDKSETLPTKRNGTYDMLNLISKFLESAGNVLLVQGLANMGASMRDAGAVILAVTSEPNKIREAFLRTADCCLKVESINDTMVIYCVKPFTNVHGVEFAFDKGYPSLRLTEIV